MKNINRHVTVVGALHIILNLISIGMALFFGFYFNAISLPAAIVVFSIFGLITGYGIIKRYSWARVLGIIMAILNLFTIPHGTIIGIYSIRVLIAEDAKRLFVKGESSNISSPEV